MSCKHEECETCFYKQKYLEELLYHQYLSEFEIIDGLKQHPSGKTFKEWMRDKVGD